MATVIDALVTTIALDPTAYKQGQQEVERSNKKIKDDIRSLEDQIAAVRQKSTKDTRAQDNAQIVSLREVMRQKRRSLEDNRGRELEQIKREKDQTQALGGIKDAALEMFAVFGLAVSAKGFVNFVMGVNSADAATGRFADNLGEDVQVVNAFGAVVEQLGGKADEARAAFANLASIRFNVQAKGDMSMLPTLSRLGVSADDLNDLDAAMRKIAATAKTMPKALFYQYAHAAGFSDGTINALELGDVELAKRIEDAKKREALTASQVKRSQDFHQRMANAGGATRGLTRGSEDQASRLLDIFSDIGRGDWSKAQKDWAEGSKNHDAILNKFWSDLGSSLFPQSGSGDARGPAPKPSPALQARRAQFAVDYLKSQGISDSAARGSIAGAIAESGLDPSAVNPKSGAFGIGQWLGGRKTALFAKYGANPTFDEQLRFLVAELKGGDRGGSSVTSAGSAWDAAVAYITQFMRPKQGGETQGDLVRARRALSALGVPLGVDPGLAVGAQAALTPYTTGSSSTGAVTNEVQIGRIEVNVPAGSDGKKIAQETAAAVRHQPFVAMANTGLA